MSNVRIYSRSNVAGNPYLWRPTGNISKKSIPSDVTSRGGATCDDINDFITTYVVKRIWITLSGVWSQPPYVQCAYVE